MITNQQGIKILEKFFQCSYNFDKLTQQFTISKRTKQQLTQFVKQKFRQLVLEIQYNLFRSGKINELKLYDKASDRMFDQLIKLQLYFPSKLAYDFIFQERCKYSKIQKSTTNKKLQLYTVFVNYAEKNDLFKYIYIQNQDVIKCKGPYENPSQMYEDEQLEILCLYYEIFDGDYKRIEQKFNERQNTSQKFYGVKLYKNLQNLQMIGLYRCQVKSTRSKGMTWQKFARNYDEKVQIVQKCLVKFAVRSQITNQQIRAICRKVGKRYQDKPFVDMLKPPPLTSQQKHNNTPQINKMRLELLAILNTKIWFNTLNHDQ